MRIALALLLAMLMAPDAQAWGRRCGYRTYQTLSSNYGWVNTCYTCHAQGTFHNKQASSGVSGILGGLAQKQGEWNTLLQGLDQLGFRPSGQASAYGMPGGSAQTSGHYSNQQGGYGNYGQSVYFRQATQADPNATLAMAERLATQTGQLAGQGYSQASALMGQNLSIAEINAVRDTAVAVLQASRPPKAASTQTFTFQTSVDSNGQVSVTPQQGAAAGGGQFTPLGGGQQDQGDYGFANIVQSRCMSCHSGKDAKGGLDFAALKSKTPAEQAETLMDCYRRVTSQDPKTRMPQNADALPAEETIVFAYAAGAIGAAAAPTQ